MTRKNLITVSLALVAILFIPAASSAAGTFFVEGNAARVENVTTTSNTLLFSLKAPLGVPIYRFESSFGLWDFTGGFLFSINQTDDPTVEFRVDPSGNLTVSGDIFTTNCPAGCGPDYVFAPDYELMPLSDLGAFIEENRHLPNLPTAGEMETNGINMTQLQLQMLEKVEELTLYTLQQAEEIEELRATLAELKAAQ